ncbi:MAG TPA: hypothetical protein VGM90_27505 [Kofleriaceae bacterium]
MKSILLVLAFATGCMAGADDPTITSVGDQPSTVYTGDVATTRFTSLYAGDPPSLCEQANELARDNVCSLMCAPDLMAARLVENGAAGGRCLEIHCELDSGDSVNVGVCIP